MSIANKFRVGTFNNISRVGLSRFRQSAYQVGALDTGDEPIQEPQAIMIRSHKLQVEEIPKSVCAIARCGAGTNNIPVENLSERGIPVFNTPGANANAVKELVLCGMLLASRRIHQGINHVKEVAKEEGVHVAVGRVESDKKLFAGQELTGKTLGVVGLGAIGAGVANAASNLGMKVIGYDPALSVEAALALNWKGTDFILANSLEHVAGAADYLSLHAPVIKGVTEGMINRDMLEQMRPTCNIINFARGELVDHSALKSAIDAGIFKGNYVSDFPNSEIFDYDQVIAMPHLGASTAEAEENSSSMAADTIMSFLETGSIINSVNFPTVKAEPKPESTAVRACIVNENKSGMLAAITNALAEFNVVRQQNDSRNNIAYNLVDLEDLPSDLDALMSTLTSIDGVLSARFITDGESSKYKLNRDTTLA